MTCKKCGCWMEEIQSEDLNSMSWGWHVTLWCRKCGTTWTGDKGLDSNRQEKYSEGFWNFIDMEESPKTIEVDRNEDLQNWIVGIERFVKHPRSKIARRLAEVMVRDMQDVLDDFDKKVSQNALDKKLDKVEETKIEPVRTIEEMQTGTYITIEQMEQDQQKMRVLKDLFFNGNRFIQMIKQVRAWTNLDLKSAKDYVDALRTKWSIVVEK